MENFLLICRPEIYRLIFIIAIAKKWIIWQYDVKNAFVYVKIDYEIYME